MLFQVGNRLCNPRNFHPHNPLFNPLYSRHADQQVGPRRSHLCSHLCSPPRFLLQSHQRSRHFNQALALATNQHSSRQVDLRANRRFNLLFSPPANHRTLLACSLLMCPRPSPQSSPHQLRHLNQLGSPLTSRRVFPHRSHQWSQVLYLLAVLLDSHQRCQVHNLQLSRHVSHQFVHQGNHLFSLQCNRRLIHLGNLAYNQAAGLQLNRATLRPVSHPTSLQLNLRRSQLAFLRLNHHCSLQHSRRLSLPRYQLLGHLSSRQGLPRRSRRPFQLCVRHPNLRVFQLHNRRLLPELNLLHYQHRSHRESPRQIQLLNPQHIQPLNQLKCPLTSLPRLQLPYPRQCQLHNHLRAPVCSRPASQLNSHLAIHLDNQLDCHPVVPHVSHLANHLHSLLANRLLSLVVSRPEFLRCSLVLSPVVCQPETPAANPACHHLNNLLLCLLISHCLSRPISLRPYLQLAQLVSLLQPRRISHLDNLHLHLPSCLLLIPLANPTAILHRNLPSAQQLCLHKCRRASRPQVLVPYQALGHPQFQLRAQAGAQSRHFRALFRLVASR